MLVTEKVKTELKRFLTPKQVEEISKQLDSYEQRVRDAVKKFDVKGRVAKAKGQVQIDKFRSQVKKTGQQLEKQLKQFMQQEGKALNQGLNDLVTYFKGLAPKEAAPARKSPSRSKAKAAPKKKRASTRAKSR